MSGFEIDDEFIFRRLLHRQIGRLAATQDLVDVVRRSAVLLFHRLAVLCFDRR